MDSPSRLERVKQGNEAFAAGDLDAIREFLHPEMVTVRVEPDHAVFHGPEGLWESVTDWTGEFADWTYENTEFLEVGERVVTCSSQTATSKTSGVPVQQDFWFVYSFSGELISRIEIYASREAAMEAAAG